MLIYNLEVIRQKDVLVCDVESKCFIQYFSNLFRLVEHYRYIGEIAENITDVKDFKSKEKSYLLLKSRLPRRWGFNLFLF
jgi:hypothetical protein